MALFTMGDLHLSFSVDKPMDIFGIAWKNHVQVLEANWKAKVGNDDTVVLVGDHSWALKPEDAVSDLTFIHQLPGRKILMKGNHDLWWPTARKLGQLCEAYGLTTLSFLQGDACVVTDGLGVGHDAVICGTRGWLCPGDREFTQQDQGIYRREGMRLESALKAADKQIARLQETGRQGTILGFMHYPPFGSGSDATIFTQLFSAYGVHRVYYGHLHGIRRGEAKQNFESQVQYQLVSGDYIGFDPICIGLND